MKDKGKKKLSTLRWIFHWELNFINLKAKFNLFVIESMRAHFTHSRIESLGLDEEGSLSDTLVIVSGQNVCVRAYFYEPESHSFNRAVNETSQ